MSTISGIGSKGEKNKSKYKTIDINTLYKGKSVETQKSSVPRQHGLQSLGKVSSVRRLPPPANLPSLKSENSGNDPTISLVPSGGSGWGKEEKKENSGSGVQPPSLQPPQVVPTSQGQQPQPTTKVSTQSGGQSSTVVRSWSNVTGGTPQGGLVSHQSPLFQEEFPSLAQEEKNKESTQVAKKDEDTKDTQYGPGPSLRPQNVASWREGGGRAVSQPKLEETAPNTNLSQIETQPNGPQMSGGVSGAGAEPQSQPPMPPRPGSGHGPPHGSIPLGPPMAMPPPPQYRGMMPPYMYGRMPPQGYPPPSYTGFRPPYPQDVRFRGPPPNMSHARPMNESEEGHNRPAIVSEKKLKDFEDLIKSDANDGGWADPQGEIDYSERLVFSDDEDDSKSPRSRSRREERHSERLLDRKEHEESSREIDNDRERKSDKDDQGAPIVRESWTHGPPHPQYRGGPRGPHPAMDGRGWPPHQMHPYDFMSRGGPGFFTRMPPPPQMRQFGPPPPPVSSPGAMPQRKSGDDEDEMWRMQRTANEGKINNAVERARLRREEDEKRKKSEQKAAAAEKLRHLEERIIKKKEESKDGEPNTRDRSTSETNDKDPRDNRYRDRMSSYTPPSIDDGPGNKGFNRNVPPRFQKQQESSMGPMNPRQPPSPGTGSSTGPPMTGFRPGQGPPPPWGYDPRHWPNIYMDPRYASRPPIDMQSMAMYGPPIPRRRNDSHGSGGDSQESERHPSEQFDRDPRGSWMERGYTHPGHFDEMRRHYYEHRYAERDFERREFDQRNQEEPRSSCSSEIDVAHKDFEKPVLLQRESFTERGKENEDKNEYKLERSISKASSTDWEKMYPKESNEDVDEDKYGTFDVLDKEILDKEEPEEPTRGYRRDGRQGPTPTFRAYSAEEVQKRESTHRRDTGAPPSAAHDQNKQVAANKNNLSTLKRSASNMSSSSAASSEKEKERKSDSPKESLIFERSSLPKRDHNLKDQSNDKSSHNKENNPVEPQRPNPWEIKEQDRLKAKEKEIGEDSPYFEDEETVRVEDRVDSPYNNRPPIKKKRDDDQDRDKRDRYDDGRDNRRDRDDRYDRDRPRSMGSRGGREFVRGRGNSRGRVRGNRGSTRDGYGGRGRRDFYSGAYDRQGSRKDRLPLMKDHRSENDNFKDDTDKKRWGSRNDNFENYDGGKIHKEPLLETPVDFKDPVKERDSKDHRQRNDSGKEGKPRDIKENKNPWNKDKILHDAPLPQNPWNKDKSSLSFQSESADKLGFNKENKSFKTDPGRQHSADSTGLAAGDNTDCDKEKSQDSVPRKDNRDRDNRRRNDRDGGNRRDRDDGGNNRRDRDDGGGRHDKDRNDRRDRDRNKDRRMDREIHEPLMDDQSNGIFMPRGEPSRRGRGGARMGGRGAGGNRYNSASTGRGGSQSFHQGGNQLNLRQGNRNRDLDSQGESRDNLRMNDSNYRRDGRRQDNRNPPPPRFARRGAMGENRERGFERGRGRSSRGRGTSAPTNLAPKKQPVLTKQMSNDGEEWETASESSEPKNDLRESRDKREGASNKKSFSNQRPFSDRQNNRRLNNQDSRNGAERRNSPKEKNSKNGQVPPTKSAANGTNSKAKPTEVVHKENVVFRVDAVIPSDPNAISNALNSIQAKKSTKKTEIIETKTIGKTEKEKKDALANIDINNYASVVVIDDQPEVTIDDPNFLFENNDGFQEVKSKKALKFKQKLIEAEQKKVEKDSKKKEHSKVVARPKGLSPKTSKSNAKGSKLPPRLAKQRERERETKMLKIEQWDNELANNIPSLLTGIEKVTAPNVTSMQQSSSGLDDGVPSISAWSKPINFGTMSAVGQTCGSRSSHGQKITAVQQPQGLVIVPTDKMDKGDHHDSGIDVSDQPNSGASSTRSSPSADNKLINSSSIPSSGLKNPDGIPVDTASSIDLAKPQRPPKMSKSDKTVVKAEASIRPLKEIEMASHKDITSTKPEPIQMPPSFKDSLFGKGDEPGLQIDFHYDESLAQINTITEQPSTPEKKEVTVKDSVNLTPVQSQPIISPTSPATEDLSSKIASVKNFWDLPSVFEHNVQSAVPNNDDLSTVASNANTNNSTVAMNSQSKINTGFSKFSHDVSASGGLVAVGGPNSSHAEDSSVTSVPSPVLQRLHSPHPAEAAMLNEADLLQTSMVADDPVTNSITEQANVCKVRPQQLHMGITDPTSMSVLSSSLSGNNMPTVASPPVVLTGQPTGFPAFQMGSQFVPQEQRYSQPSYGFNINQGQASAAIGGSQQTYSQPNLYIPSTPTQPDMFPTSQLGYAQRNHAFGQNAAAPPPPAQPSTIMVSSSTSALMSTNIKAPGPSHASAPGPNSSYNSDSMGKNLGHNPMPFGGGLNNSSIQSQQLFFYDPNPPNLGQLFQPHSQLIGSNQPSQNMNSSTLIGSQLLQQRTAVQHNSSYYQQAQPTNFYPAQQPSSIQVGAPIQQPSNATYSMQAYNNQAHGLGLTLQANGPSVEPGTAGMTMHQSLGHGLQAQQTQQHGMSSGGSKTTAFNMITAQQQNTQNLSHHMAAMHINQHSGHSMHSVQTAHSGSNVTLPQQTVLNQQNQSITPSQTAQVKSPPINSSHQTMFVSNGISSCQSQQLNKSQFNVNEIGNIGGTREMTSTTVTNSNFIPGNVGNQASKNMQSVNAGPMNMSSNQATLIQKMNSPANSMPPTDIPSTHQGPAPPPPLPASGHQSTQRTASRFLNPNAPNFSSGLQKFGRVSNADNQFGQPQTQQNQMPHHPVNQVNQQQFRAPMMGNSGIRPSTSQTVHQKQVPAFPNPIQRPAGPPSRGPAIPQPPYSGNINNQSNKGAPQVNSNQQVPLNVGPNALLSSMLMNAAQVMLNQNFGNQLNLHGNVQGPHNSSNPVKSHSGAPGAYSGPNRDGIPRHTGGVSDSKVTGNANRPPTHQNNAPNPGKAPGAYPGPTTSITSLKAQQAQQRQEVLNHAANFLNKNKTTAPNKSVADSKTISTTSNVEGKKPALAMVSNPGLVGTSVKIDLSNSNNTRAPAISSSGIVSGTNSSSVSIETKEKTFCTSDNPEVNDN